MSKDTPRRGTEGGNGGNTENQRSQRKETELGTVNKQAEREPFGDRDEGGADSNPEKP